MSVPSRARRSWIRLSGALAGLVTAFAVGAVGRPQPEEIDPKGGVKKRVVVEDDPVVVKPKGPDVGFLNTPDVKLDELAREAEEAKFPGLKALYLRHVVPFDQLAHKGGTSRIKPIPVGRAERFPLLFGIQELKANGQFGEPQGINAADVQKVEYFEDIVLKAANDLLALKPFGTAAGGEAWSAAEQLVAAERLMGAALRFHDYARENPRERPIRKGRGWDEVRKPLADRLREIRLRELNNAATVGDWQRLRESGSRLMLAYPKDPDVAAAVASARVLEANRLLASEKHFDHVKAKDLLDEFEARYPGGGGEPVRALRAKINELAQKAFTRAVDKKKASDLVTARDALAQAAALDPTIPGLRDLQRELKAGYQTLYVGVRDYPVAMSPATARLDSERQVVELVFEGLLGDVPDDGAGARYRPGAAVTMPAVVPNGREFLLRTLERDPSGRFGFEAHDVVDTVKLLQTKAHTWGAYALPWLDELPTPKDSTTVRLGFKQGHPDPRSLLTFKLLPARWLVTNGMPVDDAAFAEKPTGTGPFRLQYNPKADPNVPREMVFVDNPLYARWRDRANQPYIKEVRLVEIAKIHNLIESFQQGSLHVLTDVPTGDLDTFMAPGANLAGKVQAHTAANNRRIYMLAVNHRRRPLQSKALRQGLSLALDREAILTDVFRAGKPEHHAALGGPFPPRSWATVKGPNGLPLPLANRDLAEPKLRTYLGDPGARAKIKLVYPAGDPLAERACKKIQEQVGQVFKDQTGPKLVIELEAPVPLRDLLFRVEEQHEYDLAYVPFDYPDDWYPYALGAMLDPLAIERGGRNWMGFAPKNGADEQDARLSQLLIDLRAYRDFHTLTAKTADAHKLFNECVPFIPLWQLDRHMLVHNAVKVYTEDSELPVSPRVLDPTTLFQGVARWRLEG